MMAGQTIQTGQTIRARQCVHCGHLNGSSYLACQSCRQVLSGSAWVEAPVQTEIHEEPKLSIHEMPTAKLPNGKHAQTAPSNVAGGFFQERNTGALQGESSKTQTTVEEETKPSNPFHTNKKTQTMRSTIETLIVSPTMTQVQVGTPIFTVGMMICMTIDAQNTPIVLRPTQGQSVIIGRDEAKSSERPDIDLMPFGAFKHGVSRQHASLELIGKCLMIKDLGSSNGTFLNSARLDAHESHQLRDGDTLRMGQMKLNIAFKR